jgi:lysophospholipase L1-like esterase
VVRNAVAVLLGLTTALALGVVAELEFRHARHGTFELPAGTWVSDPDLIYRLNPANPETPGSFRATAPGPRAVGRVRIVCLGGSTTYGHGVRPRDAWPAVLERVLEDEGIPAEVINGGVPGYGSRQILLRYRRDIARLRPDVVLFYEGWNRTGALVDPAGWVPLATPRPDAALGQRAGTWIADHSLILQESIAGSWTRTQAGEWSMDPYPDVFVSDVTALAREVQADGHRALLIVYPALYHAGMSVAEMAEYAPLLWDAETGRPYDYRPEMLMELERKHAALRQVAAATGAAFIDAHQAFRDVRGAARRSLFLDAQHLSAPGNRRLAGILAERLAQMLTGSPSPLSRERRAALPGDLAGQQPLDGAPPEARRLAVLGSRH